MPLLTIWLWRELVREDAKSSYLLASQFTISHLQLLSCMLCFTLLPSRCDDQPIWRYLNVADQVRV